MAGPRSYDSTYILKMIMEGQGVTNKSGDLEADRGSDPQGLGRVEGL